jgi:hypothetical protein
MSALLNNITRAAWSAIKDGDTPDWHFDAETFLSTLAAAGYAVVPVREITELRDQVNAYACDLRAISAVARRQGEIIAAASGETKA